MSRNFKHTVYNYVILYSNVGSADDIADLNIYYVASVRQLGIVDFAVEHY